LGCRSVQTYSGQSCESEALASSDRRRGGAGQHSVHGSRKRRSVDMASPRDAAAVRSPANKLITSSERKKPRQKDRDREKDEVVVPRNLGSVFVSKADPDEDEGNKQGPAAGASADDKGKGKQGSTSTRGMLSNLLFSPVFTLLGPKFSRRFSNAKAPEEPTAGAGSGAGSREEEKEKEKDRLTAHEEAMLVAADPYGFEVLDDDLDDDLDGEEDGDFDYAADFDPFYFIKTLPPLHECVPDFREILLPKQTRQMRRRKTLVLDLDETLVHSRLDVEGAVDCDFSFPVHLDGECYNIYVWVRPGVREFMEAMVDKFEIVVFTASQEIYAQNLLNILDSDRRYIRHRLFRDSCVLVEGNYLKDLSVLGRDLKDTIIIDNSPQAFAFQLENGVPIESWFDDDQDRELVKLIPFLQKLAQVEDVRPAIVKKFRLHDKVARA